MTVMPLGSSFLAGMLATEGGPEEGGGPDRILVMLTPFPLAAPAPRLWMAAVPGAAPRVGMAPEEAPRLVTLLLVRMGVCPVSARPTPDSFTRIRLCLCGEKENWK